MASSTVIKEHVLHPSFKTTVPEQFKGKDITLETKYNFGFVHHVQYDMLLIVKPNICSYKVYIIIIQSLSYMFRRFIAILIEPVICIVITGIIVITFQFYVKYVSLLDVWSKFLIIVLWLFLKDVILLCCLYRIKTKSVQRFCI
jgi:hypothetical protein